MKTRQTKIDRSAAKWLPGAMALAATTASSQAATVQITLTGNKISTTGGNQLMADLTGDELDDVTFDDALWGSGGVSVTVNTFYLVRAVKREWGFSVSAGWDGRGVGTRFISSGSPLSAAHLNRITFTDAKINGGLPTEGWLQVNAFNTSATDHTVEFSRLIFDDASTTRPGFAEIPGPLTEWQVSAVPEPGSNLALLALGAGGLILRRRLKRAA